MYGQSHTDGPTCISGAHAVISEFESKERKKKKTFRPPTLMVVIGRCPDGLDDREENVLYILAHG